MNSLGSITIGLTNSVKAVFETLESLLHLYFNVFSER